MPLLRVLYRLSVLAVVVCFFGVLAALRLGFGSDAPVPPGPALRLAALAALGLLLSGLALWWLGRKLDRSSWRLARAAALPRWTRRPTPNGRLLDCWGR
ncbi:hypothetical protein SAMN04488058_10149 [Deinococcus reticulitermitis]|uniref:Uncharacterized protein n=1 Tax=Deinococcus reticulitermitis TaxID=856736 RepID=A0A1H6RRI2_9DEIO|nr:hypothetical protein SAMN04488058_10149 [Deinococcus reticulitermitis]